MKQSTVIFGTLLLAFVIYITLRGQLPDYFSLFTGEASSSVAGAGSPQSSEQESEEAGGSMFDGKWDNPLDGEYWNRNFNKFLDTLGMKG